MDFGNRAGEIVINDDGIIFTCTAELNRMKFLYRPIVPIKHLIATPILRAIINDHIVIYNLKDVTAIIIAT